MTIIDWDALLPPYTPDTRGGKLQQYKVGKTTNREGDMLLLCGPDEVASQLWLAAGGVICSEGKLSDEGKKKWTQAIRFPGGVPTFITDLADMLKVVVSIPSPNQVDRSIALDWYTVPDDEEGLARTTAGDWIHYTKHASHPEYGNSVRSRRRMVDSLVDFIKRHPAYASASAIIAAPGHLADGQSFGEKLARQVAKEAGIPFVESSSPGPRAAQFETKQDLTQTFTVEGALSGTVIVLDDVYQTGGSATGAAAAARRAGASAVVSLAVARTIRK